MPIRFRPAGLNDIKKLVEIEDACFEMDKLSDKNFKYFLEKAHASLIIAEYKKEVAGYALLLFHRSTSLARLYSIAVSPNFRDKKIGLHLMEHLEKVALSEESTYIRLEVRTDNLGAIKLYERLGYRKFAHKVDYYEDHKDAICYEKKIRKQHTKKLVKVPYYKQTTDFTCGPSSLMMAMKALNKKIEFSRWHEIQLWREATTVFMTSGHGGCGPHGLALSAHHRGFQVELYLNTKSYLFISGVRGEEKKDVIKVVQEGFEKEIKKNKIKVIYDEYDWKTLRKIFQNGGIPLVLISSYRLTETKSPHWITITGIEEDFIYFHDPDPDLEKDQTAYDNMDVPVRRDEFEKMAKFGSKQIKSIVAIYKKNG